MKTVLKIFLPVMVLGTTGGLIALLVANKQEIKPEPRVVVFPVVEVLEMKPGPHRFVVRSQGTVAARTEIDLMGEVPGKIVWVADGFAEGGFFRKGDPLVRIDRRDFELAVTQAEAAVARSKVAWAREQAEAKVAKKEWEQHGKGRANPLLLREPQLADVEAALRSADANLAKAKLDLDRCELSAPFDGRVRSRHVGLGQFINRGVPVGRIYAVDYVEVPLPLPLDELDYIDLTLGQGSNAPQPAVQVTASIGGRLSTWDGRLVRTAGDIHPQTRMLTGIVRIDDPYGIKGEEGSPPLPVGLFVEATIEGREVLSVYRVPRAAMRGRDQLMVVDAEDRFRFRSVKVVRLLKDEAMLKSGIEEGDRVCISILDSPVDGMKVSPKLVNR